jgi:CHAT domain-containing protein/Tfp pilus assembly protein PilF
MPDKNKFFPLLKFCLRAAIAILSLECLAAAQDTTKITADSVTLEASKPVAREFPGGLDAHAYRVKMAAGQYAKIVVNQRSVDVSEQLSAPDGNVLTRFDSELRLQQPDEIEFVAAQPGEYRIDVKTKYKSAAGGYEIRLLEIRDATEKDKALFEANADSLKGNDLAIVGKYSDAAPLLTHALETAEKQLGADDVRLARILNRLGYLQRQQGSYALAEATLQRALAINEKSLGPEHPNTVESMQFLGLVYRSSNEFAKADKMYRNSLAVTERVLGKGHPWIVQQLINLETLLQDMGDSQEGERLLQRALDIAGKHFEPDSLTMANILNNLGSLYLDTREYSRAEPYFRQVLAIYEKTIGVENDRYSNTLQNLGVVLRAKKDYPRALEVQERALAIREKTLGKEHLYLAPLLSNIANVYHAMGNDTKALEIQRRAREIAEKGGGLHHVWAITSLGNIARYYMALGDAANALAFQTISEQRSETALAFDLAIGSERLKLLQLEALEEKTSRTISLNVNLAPAEPKAAALAALVLLQRKGRVLDAMSDSFNALRERFNPDDKELLDELNSITEQLAKITLNKSLKMSLEEQREQIARLTEKKELLEADISRRSAEFHAASEVVTLDAVKAEIPAGAALLEFAVYRPYDAKAVTSDEAYGKPRYIAYVLQRDGDVRWKDLGDKEAVDAAINQWRKALRDPKRNDAQVLGRAADEKIMRPVRALLGNARQLFVSPDGALNLIPFEALVDEQNHYLIENYSFSYLTSGRDLLRMKVARASKSKALVIANPSFGETMPEQALVSGNARKPSPPKRNSVTSTRSVSDTYFAPLAGTVQEAKSIQTLFPESTLLTGGEATETALKQVSAPAILHIATHGFFLEDEAPGGLEAALGKTKKADKAESPLLRSGLALAGANRHAGADGDDGILTAFEASGLNLWGTKLVVLSACDTGIGEIKNGEGVYGLRRAFVLAGTESLVMSLWPVSDYVTRQLMKDYYRNLKEGVGRGEALRKVQLGLLKQKGREHPFYWAGFIESGEWANLDGKR